MNDILLKPIRLAFLATIAVCVSWVAQAGVNSNDKGLKYPVVLIHGFMGFGAILGDEYFVGIPQALAKENIRVFEVNVSGVHSTEMRGEQLLEHVENIIALTGQPKVHLFGHSHGSLTARYVAAVAPDMVASVTSIAGVNQGTKVADLIRGVIKPGTFSEWFVDRAFGLYYRLSNILAGDDEQIELKQSPKDALKSLTSKGVREFNQRYPAGMAHQHCGQGALQENGVYYFSWGGVTRPMQGSQALDHVFGLLSMLIGESNDGIVSQCSNHLGHVIADKLPLNHLDFINVYPGTYGGSKPDPVKLYFNHVKSLNLLGL